MNKCLLPVRRLSLSLIQMNRLLLLLFGMVTYVAQAQVPDYVPTEGLVGYWLLNGNANDESGNGNHGTIFGAEATADHLGNANSALHFNVSSGAGWGAAQDRVVISNPTIPDNNAFTMSSWVKLEPKPSPFSNRPHSIMGRWDGNGVSVFRHQLNYDGDISTQLVGGGSEHVFVAGSISYDAWSHVIITYDGETLRHFVNGSLIGTENLDIVINTSSTDLTFGEIHMGNGHWYMFSGTMDDCGYWSRALSESEITVLYTEQLSIPGCTDSTACNFDAEATSDDGSCTYPPIGSADCVTASSAQSEWELIVPQESLPDSYRSDEFLFDSTTRQWYVHYQEDGLLASIDVDAGTVTEIGATNWFGRSDEMVLDPIGQKLYGWRAGTSSLYEISTSGGSWSQVFSAGNDGHHYGASAYWNGETSRPGFIGGYGYWTMHNQIFEVNSSYSGWTQKRGDTNTGNPPRMNGPIAGNGEGNALLWYGHHGNINGNQYTCNLSISDGGNYCWSRGLWHIDLASHTASTIMSLDDPEIDQYGDIAWDYLRNEVYVVGGKLVSPDATNTTNEDDYEWTSRVIRFNLDTSDGFTVLESEGLPVLETYGQVIFDETEDRLLMLRSDGLWALPLSQESSQESNPTSIPDDFCSTTYYPNSNESHKTCRFQLAMDSLHAINGSPTAPSLMDFLKGQTIGNKVYLEWDMQAIMDSINAVIAEISNVDSGGASEHTCGDPLSYYGYDYATVQIGEQCWFAENARRLPFVSPSNLGWEDDGNAHAYVAGYEGTLVEEAQMLDEYEVFGALYNFAAVEELVMCPQGWHVPSVTEWNVLEAFVGPSSAFKLKAESPVWDGTNELGFNAIRVPVRTSGGTFGNWDEYADFWTSTPFENSDNAAWGRELNTGDDEFTHDDNGKNAGAPVRCIKD